MSSAKRHHNALPEGYRLHWYEIQSILGRGGFGITYLARDTNLNHLVAIKEFLPTELAVRADDSSIHPMSDEHVDTYGWGLSRFITEAQTLAQFRHPNIVLVHSVFEANNTAYMVMEYERGESLEEAFNFKKLQTEEELLGLLFPLMSGLERIHEAGFVHRDIKPKNIYLRDDGRPVLLDFGSARQALGVETRTLTTLVSPGYAPFEQYNATRDSDKQGPWTDMYALGATIYRGIAGKSPVDALTRANAKLEGRTDVLESAQQAGKGRFSEQFLAAIDWSLSFAPEERPQSIADWRAMLPDHTDTDGTREYTARATTRAAPTVAADAPTMVPGDTRGETAEERFTSDGTLIVGKGDVEVHAARARAESAQKRGGKGPWIAIAAGVVAIAVGLAVWQMRSGDTAPGATPAGGERASAGAQPAASPPTPVLSAEVVNRRLLALPCSALLGSVDGGNVTVRGYAAGDDASARIDDAVREIPGVTQVANDVTMVPKVKCKVLETYRPYWRANAIEALGATIRTARPENKFAGGDRLEVELTMPRFASHFYVDYYALDGSVVHMVPSPGEEENEAAAGARVQVGEPEGNGRWDVAPPFGREFIVLLAVSSPVAEELRDQVEEAEVYLDELAARLGSLRKANAKAGIAADFLVIQTGPAS